MINDSKKIQDKIKSRLAFLFIFVILATLFFTAQVILAAPIVTITDPPSAQSAELPTVIANGDADAGDTIESASYQIYPSASAPTGSKSGAST